MGIRDKINNAKSVKNWLVEGLSEAEIKQNRDLGRISAEIELKRIKLHMNQEEFADLLGVSQSMVSKYESGEYNFSIKTLNEICIKIGLSFTPDIYDPNCFRDNIRVIAGSKKNPFIPDTYSIIDNQEAIA